MADRASAGLFPLVLFALILVISAVAVVLGSDDANSAGTVAVDQTGHAGVAAAPGAGGIDAR